MAKKEVGLKKVSLKDVNVFKIKNRKGYAMVCKNNLTEGSTRKQAAERMDKALKKMGYILP
jgi:hypothetical protein